MTSTTAAYKGTMTKPATLKQLRAHRKLDQIVQGTYWQGNGDGRGCAVGCLTHDPSGGHEQFPEKWGVPVQLAYLMDHIFESLPLEEAKDWPVRIMSAIAPGSDLSGVYDRWALWMLRRLIEKAPAGTPMAEVEVMASLFERVTSGDEPSDTEWREAARAAWAAGAARAAGAAWAARAAGAAWAAWAAGAAGAARAAGAAWAAWAAGAAGAARAARAARADARREWGRAAADELVRLVKAAPPAREAA